MKFTRRKLLKASAVIGGGAAAGGFFSGGLETLERMVSAAAENPPAPAEEWVPTTCWIGKQECGIRARRIGGRVVKLEGDPNNPRNKGKLCPKGQAQIMAMYDPNRVKTPLIRTNEKGVSGKWRKASWDEALTLVAQKMNEARKKDPRLLVWQKGRSKGKPFYDDAFVKATGATKLHHGAFCSDAGYRACEYTVGLHGVLHPDIRHTRYMLNWGWNITNAGGNKYCWMTWNQHLIAARERGIKVVTIDPRSRGAGPFSNEWLPIRPGTDMALALAIMHSLIKQGTIDRDYLQKYTNGPHLVKDDGLFLRIDGKEQVWDSGSGSPRPAGDTGIEPALEGEFTVGGTKVKTSFQLLKEQVAGYTPEWAEGICGIPAGTISQVARELGEHAQIGSTMTVDGVALPYRPVGIMAYHMAQQELGFQAIRSMLMVMMLLGAVGAVGGQRIDSTWKIHDNYAALEKIKVKDPPYNIYLKDSKFFPINSNNSAVVAKVMQDPKRYGVDYEPEVLIVHMANPVLSFGSQPDIIASYKKFKFVTVIDPWLSETADLFADVVLPAATLEKYEGPMSVDDQYISAVAMRVPVMKPMFESRGDIQIYLDLCEKAGILFGEGGYLNQINKALKLKAPNTLPLDKTLTERDIFDYWAKSEGIAEGISYFEKYGIKVKGAYSVSEIYGYAAKPVFGGAVHRLYGESLLRLQGEMKAKGAEEVYWRDYTALPAWRNLSMDGSPKEYDLYLISYKMIEFKQSRAAQVPLLHELAPRQRLDIHPKTAAALGVGDQDEVWVESHNALTNETRKVKVHVHFTEAIRPDVVGMPHHYGMWTHPGAKNMGPSANQLFFTGEGYVANTADQSFQCKVRVVKA